MHLHEYLAETEKQYHLRLKTVVPLDDAAMERIEMTLAKYMPLMISTPKRTILQRQPLEFPDVQNAEVYIVDMTFGLPAAPPVIRDDLRKALNAPDSHVFIRNMYSPGEVEIARLNAVKDIETEATAKGLTLVAMLDDEDYNESEEHDNAELFGNSYNRAFLNYLGTVQQERQAKVAKVETAPFNWLDLPDRADQIVQDDADFNAHIPGAPKVAPTETKGPEVSTSILGFYRPAPTDQVRRLYQDANGKRVVLTRELGDI